MCSSDLVSGGTPLPARAYCEDGGVGGGGSGGYDRSGSGEKKDREYYLRLSRAGLAGCRSWMAWLAARREDPPYSESFVDEAGKITGNNLLKATMVAEYFQETGQLDSLMKGTVTGRPSRAGKSGYKVFEEALAIPLPTFE